MMQIKTLCILSHFVKLKTNILRRKKKGSLLKMFSEYHSHFGLVIETLFKVY